jgi:hypothetical protein
MHSDLLLLALVYLDRLTDPDCGETEADELTCEIETLHRFMRPADSGYFQAILDVVNYAQSN